MKDTSYKMQVICREVIEQYADGDFAELFDYDFRSGKRFMKYARDYISSDELYNEFKADLYEALCEEGLWDDED